MAEPEVGKFDRPPAPKDWRFWVGGLGRVLIAAGFLMFGFVAYQLWGTGIETARAQSSLESDFNQLIGPTSTPPSSLDTSTGDSVPDSAVVTTVDPSAANLPTTTIEPVPVEAQNIPAIKEGDAIARLEIPAIGVDKIVVAGVEKSDLKKGPGHYPDTPLPGQLGNAAIAGHRTTYGQPFYDIDKLKVGDEIIATTPSGRFVYTVTGQQIVSADDYQVVATTDPTVASLTLTSCHPKYTASQRIVVTSTLDQASSTPVGATVINYGRPVVAQPATDAPTPTIAPSGGDTAATATPAVVAATQTGIADDFSAGWFSDSTANLQVAFWGVILALIGLGSWLLSRRTKHDWIGLAVGVLPFVVALYFFFQNVNRLLPPNL
jgi:sortase A